MINLTGTTDKLQVITSSGADIDVHASFVDNASNVMTPGKQNTAITTATTTDIVATPGASVVRNVKFLSLRNIDASLNNALTVQINVSATLYTLMKFTLLAGEEMICVDGVWFHFDAAYGLVGRRGVCSPIGSTSALP